MFSTWASCKNVFNGVFELPSRRNAQTQIRIRQVVIMVQLRESCLCWEWRGPGLSLILKPVTARRRGPRCKPQGSSSSIGRRSDGLQQGILTPSLRLRQQRHAPHGDGDCGRPKPKVCPKGGLRTRKAHHVVSRTECRIRARVSS
jgi:hypothetical protein